MKIAVAIKRVPDMEQRFKVLPDGSGVDPAGLKFDMSDFDGYAVEVALQLVEKAGAGEVVVISLGPDGVQETLRKALGMGATSAIQLKADGVPAMVFAGNEPRSSANASTSRRPIWCGDTLISSSFGSSGDSRRGGAVFPAAEK